jgi:hypothetical protein
LEGRLISCVYPIKHLKCMTEELIEHGSKEIRPPSWQQQVVK